MKFIKLERMQDSEYQWYCGVDDSEEMPALICEAKHEGVAWIVIVDCKGTYIERYVDNDNHQCTPNSFGVDYNEVSYKAAVKLLNNTTVEELERMFEKSNPINI